MFQLHLVTNFFFFFIKENKSFHEKKINPKKKCILSKLKKKNHLELNPSLVLRPDKCSILICFQDIILTTIFSYK